MSFTRQHLLGASDLNESEIRHLLAGAKKFAQSDQAGNTPSLLAGKTIVNLFFENSTRTRTSFELATRKLGGGVLNFAASTSSVSKGETLIDTAQVIEAMKPHCLVVRHSSAGAPMVLSKAVKMPVVNAGDGFHEHPTQALLDALTMESKLGSLKGKKVLILGDIAHSRVARSNIHVLRALGASVSVCAPPSLLPPKSEALGVGIHYRLEDVIGEADVVMALRIQLERQNKMQIPSVVEYAKFWGLSKERVSKMKKSAIIMHPGPINRGVEIDPEVADSPNSVILDQVANGIYVRMSVLAALVNPADFKEFA
jgi:aspartate carbamoyltransferase catalytic subunit